jgi:hypothetical protein
MHPEKWNRKGGTLSQFNYKKLIDNNRHYYLTQYKMSANSENDMIVYLNFLQLCRENHLTEVKEYFDRYCDSIDVDRMYFYSTPLTMAIEHNTFEVVEYLITVCRANIDISLLYATSCNNVDIVRLVLDKGVDTSLKNWGGQTALEIARDNNFTKIIAILESPMIKSANKV